MIEEYAPHNGHADFCASASTEESASSLTLGAQQAATA
jgi:hypothetical protein